VIVYGEAEAGIVLVLKVAEKPPLLELMLELVAFWPSIVTVTVPVG